MNKFTQLSYLVTLLFIVESNMLAQSGLHSLFLKANYQTTTSGYDTTLWAMGQNTYGQLGDGTGFSRVSPVKVSTGVHLYEMPPGAHATVLVHEATGGIATKSAIYTMGSTASLYATPTGGYLFNGWTGGTTSSQNPITLVANQNIEVNATFTPDTNDTDGDGLSNYREVVILGTDPNDINSDDDNFTDYEEDQYGLDPNVANTNLLAYISTRENTVRAEGNASGIAYVQANTSAYNLYTEVDKNASDLTQYTSGKTAGITEGNASGIVYVQANTSAYNLYTEVDKNASDLTQYTSGKTAGITEGNASGIVYVQANTSAYNLYTEADKNASVESAKTTAKAEATATVQADLASKGLSLISYVEQIEFSKPYTQNWFYQPGMGWMWTDEDTFPYIYLVKAGNEIGAWLYFGQLSGQDSASFYDYESESWITPSDSK